MQLCVNNIDLLQVTQADASYVARPNSGGYGKKSLRYDKYDGAFNYSGNNYNTGGGGGNKRMSNKQQGSNTQIDGRYYERTFNGRSALTNEQYLQAKYVCFCLLIHVC